MPGLVLIPLAARAPRIPVIASPLPRNANGKLLKRDMREQLQRELTATA